MIELYDFEREDLQDQADILQQYLYEKYNEEPSEEELQRHADWMDRISDNHYYGVSR